MDRLTNRKINSSEPPPPKPQTLTLQPRTAYPAATNGLPAARRVTLQRTNGLPCCRTRRVTLQRTNSLPCNHKQLTLQHTNDPTAFTSSYPAASLEYSVSTAYYIPYRTYSVYVLAPTGFYLVAIACLQTGYPVTTFATMALL
jgi:hypothetical protein